MFLKGALICLLAVWFEIDAAKKGKFLKKLAKPNELGYQLEKAVKSNLKDDVSSNNASITSNEEDISTLQDKFDGLQADYNASITSNEEDISTLQDKFDGLQADYNASITSTEEDISNLQDKLDNLQSDYISLQADYNASKGDISTLMDKLDSLQSDYISLRADYNVLKAGVQINADKIQEGILANTNLNTTLADVASNIANITADIHDNAWSIANNIVDISNNKVDVVNNLANITKNAMDIASLFLALGIFAKCNQKWCLQSGLTKSQYTKCESVTNQGRTCNNPEIKYGSTTGGLPKYYSHQTSPYVMWCQQLGGTYSTHTLGTRTGYCVYWGTGSDEPGEKWKDCQDGYWYNSSLDGHETSESDFITSITCN